MHISDQMNALILKQDGFANKPPAGNIWAPETLAPFLKYDRIKTPEPARGQVLVKLRMAAVNPSDMAFIQGAYGQPRIKGQAAGFEGVGEVVATGSGFMAKRLKGKRVAFVARSSGAWAQYAIADALTCIVLDKAMRDEDGAAMIVNPLTALAMFDIVKQQKRKSFIMSAGASQLCKLITGLAREEGYQAISIVRRDSHIEPLRKVGAKHVLNSRAKGFSKQLAELIKSEKPAIFLDAVTGSESAQIFHQMGKKSRWIVYGKLSDEVTPIVEPGQLIFLDKRIEGFWLVKWMQKTPIWRKLAAIKKAQNRFISGQWQTDIAATLKLDEAHDRVPALLAKQNAGKIMFDFRSDGY